MRDSKQNAETIDEVMTRTTGQEFKQLIITDVEIKSSDDDDFPNGFITGHANVFNNIDLAGEKVMPGAFKRTIAAFKKAKGSGLPLMDNHQLFGGTDSVIGKVVHLEEDKKGLLFKAFFSAASAAQDVRTKIQEGILDSLSIGYMVMKDRVTTDRTSNGRGNIRELLELKLREISVVVFPANEKALISAVKMFVEEVAVCEDEDRVFDEGMAYKRWKDYVGHGEDSKLWSASQWEKFASGFGTVDMTLATMPNAFTNLLVDVIDGEPQLVLAAVKAADAEDDNVALALSRFADDGGTPGKSEADDDQSQVGPTDEDLEAIQQEEDDEAAAKLEADKADTLKTIESDGLAEDEELKAKAEADVKEAALEDERRAFQIARLKTTALLLKLKRK